MGLNQVDLTQDLAAYVQHHELLEDPDRKVFGPKHADSTSFLVVDLTTTEVYEISVRRI